MEARRVGFIRLPAWMTLPITTVPISSPPSPARRKVSRTTIAPSSVAGIDYKKDDFEKVLNGYDVVLNSLGKDTLEKSLRVLKLGGKLISISGPPDPDFARDNGSSWFLQQVMRLLSFSIRKKAKRRRVSYSFLFMRANGEQLSKITSLIESGILRPVMDRVFPFEATNDALDYIETGRSKGKVVVKVR
jgi:NADPH:quinone reductase-like Zn-dependent oxidoreductase